MFREPRNLVRRIEVCNGAPFALCLLKIGCAQKNIVAFFPKSVLAVHLTTAQYIKCTKNFFREDKFPEKPALTFSMDNLQEKSCGRPAEPEVRPMDPLRRVPSLQAAFCLWFYHKLDCGQAMSE